MQLTVRVARSDSYIGSCLMPGVTPVGACRPSHIEVLEVLYAFAMGLFHKPINVMLFDSHVGL